MLVRSGDAFMLLVSLARVIDAEAGRAPATLLLPPPSVSGAGVGRVCVCEERMTAGPLWPVPHTHSLAAAPSTLIRGTLSTTTRGSSLSADAAAVCLLPRSLTVSFTRGSRARSCSISSQICVSIHSKTHSNNASVFTGQAWAIVCVAGFVGCVDRAWERSRRLLVLRQQEQQRRQ